ncbi:MAG: esterase family protein [Phaeodactylibacter sp.]|nr:esterase family protein [Phaeodactylibacter sp.]MCB9299380.1 esterase family protein [Lewinellaceae bacterium]
MKRFSFFLQLFFVFVLPAFAASVDTVSIYSTAMGKDMPAIIIRPDSYDTATAPFPAVYLLHGAGGDYTNWLTLVPSIQQQADLYQMLIICPDGGNTSWYFDSPVDPAMRYETFIAKELVGWVDGHYQTAKSSAARAITGLSMGGHGAFYLAFRHPDIWGAAGSMSGGVDLRPFPNNWDIAQRLGDYATHRQNWEDNSVVNLLYLWDKNHPLALIFDCGAEDFFLEVNRRLKQEMDYRNIPHTYIERPGAHNWVYWNEAVQYQLLFFKAYFE